MKRWCLCFLCATVCLGLTACSATILSDKEDSDVSFETFSAEPPATASASASLYSEAMLALSEKRYADAYSLFFDLGDYEQAQEYLSRFSWLPDVLLTVDIKVDNAQWTEYYHYDPEGKLTAYGESRDLWTIREESDWESGTLTEIRSCGNQTVRNTYDSQGRLYQYSDFYDEMAGLGNLKETQITYMYDGDRRDKDNGSERTIANQEQDLYLFQGHYSYDDAGKLIRYDREYTWGVQGTYWETYSYDENGRLIRFESQKLLYESLCDMEQTCVREYSYDAEGNLVILIELTGQIKSRTRAGEKTVEEESHDWVQTLYTYEEGRLVEEMEISGQENPVITQKIYSYGDYLAYDAT